MRTKNLNLKKKIAFIASVAMIATTAAYLPAEVTQNILNDTSIIAEATDTAITGLTHVTKIKILVGANYLKANGTVTAVENDGTDFSTRFTAGGTATTAATFTLNAANKTFAVPDGTKSVSVKAVVYTVDGTYQDTSASPSSATAVVGNKTEVNLGSFDGSGTFTAANANIAHSFGNDGTFSASKDTVVFDGFTTAASTKKAGLNSVKAYVTINNKFLAVGKSTKAGEFKYYNTYEAFKNDNDAGTLWELKELETNTSGHNGYEAITVDNPKVRGAASDYDYDGLLDAYGYDAAFTGCQLPSDTPVNAEIGVKFILQDSEKNSFFVGDKDSYSIKLDDKGEATFRKSKTIAVVRDSVTLNDKDEYAAGEIEYFDLKNLKFSVAKKTSSGIFQSNKWEVASLDNQNISLSQGDLKKVSVNGKDVYATTLTATLDPANFTSSSKTVIKQGCNVSGKLVKKAGYTTSADPTLQFGKNGKAESSVIEIKNNSTGISSYYIVKLTVKSANTGNAITDKITLTGDGNTHFASGITLAGGAGGVWNGSAGNKNAKVYTETEALPSGEYATVVYIYTTDGITKDREYTIEGTNTDSASGKTDCLYPAPTGTAYFGDGTITNTDNIETVDKNDTNTEIGPLYLGDAARTPVKFVISSDYKIPVEYQNDEDNFNKKLYDDTAVNGTAVHGWELADADVEADVTGGKAERPAKTPTKAGYKFDGWYKTDKDGQTAGNWEDGVLKWTDDAAHKVYGATTTNASNDVTPYDTLVAKWKAVNYKVVLDANGGSFDVSSAAYNGEWDVLDTDADDNTVLVSAKSNAAYDLGSTGAAKVGPEAAIAFGNSSSTGVKPKKNGYRFVGWALDKNADKNDVLDADSYEEALPTVEDAELKIYAIWEAKEQTVDFEGLGGAAMDKTITDQADYFATPNGMTVSTSSVKVKTGQKIAFLPEAKLDGYTFDGWYRKVIGEDGKLSIAAVTTDTVIDYKFLNGAVSGSGNLTDSGDDLTLYAKFSKNTYKITYNLAGGEWPSKTVEKAAIKEFTTTLAGTDVECILFDDKNNNNTKDAGDDSFAPVMGTGAYREFTGWKINNVNKKYTTPNELAAALVKADSDVTLTATYGDFNAAGTGAIYLDLNDGEYWGVDTDNNSTKYYNYIVDTVNHDKDAFADTEAPFISGDANTAIKEEINGARIFDPTPSNTKKDFYVARAGYEFTGWYSDEACTKPYTFNKYPDNEEITVYAGWQPLSTTRYTLVYNLVDEDGSLVNIVETVGNEEKNLGTEGMKTYMGTTGTLASSKDKVITYKGKKYVFDSKLSKGMKLEEEITAEFKNAGDVKDDDAANKISGPTSALEMDSDAYAKVYGVYVVEGTQSAVELEAPTNVEVKGSTVTWKAADGAVAYRYKIIDKNGTVKYAAKTVTGTTQTIAASDLPKDTYQIAVIAIDKNKKTKTSTPIKVTPVTTGLTAATNVKWTDGVLTWKAATGATKYNVKKVYADGTVKYLAAGANLKLDLPAENKAFDAYVISVDVNNDTKLSEKVAVTASTTALGIVTDAKYDAATNTVSWTAVNNAVKYNVCKMVNGKKFWVSAGDKTSVTFSTKTDVFNYYVVAVDKDGKTTTGTMQGTPAVATNIKVGADKKTVTFTAATGAKSYKLAKVGSKGNSYTDAFTGTTGKFKFTCAKGQKIFVLAIFDDNGKQTTRSEVITVK